jgi:hypothetical protein
MVIIYIMSVTEKHQGGKRKRSGRKTSKSSACVGLSKDSCVFPCKKVRKSKSSSEFGHCQTIFSRKKKYLDAKTKALVYNGLKKGKKTEKRAKKLRKKADSYQKMADSANEEAEKKEEETKTTLQSISEALFGKSEDKPTPTVSSESSEPSVSTIEEEIKPTEEPSSEPEDSALEEPKPEESTIEEPASEEPKPEESTIEEPASEENQENKESDNKEDI